MKELDGYIYRMVVIRQGIVEKKFNVIILEFLVHNFKACVFKGVTKLNK